MQVYATEGSGPYTEKLIMGGRKSQSHVNSMHNLNRLHVVESYLIAYAHFSSCSSTYSHRSAVSCKEWFLLPKNLTPSPILIQKE